MYCFTIVIKIKIINHNRGGNSLTVTVNTAAAAKHAYDRNE